MTRAQQKALEAYHEDIFEEASWTEDVNERERLAYQEGYEQAEKDIIGIIETRISEIMSDAQPGPVLRIELRDLIKKIKDE